MDEEKLSVIALNSLPYMHPVMYHELVKRFGSARRVFSAAPEELRGVKDVGAAMAELIKTSDPGKLAEDEIALAEKLEADIFLLGQEGYPRPLEKIFAPPPALYVMGQWRQEDEMSIAVVGTRGPTAYGRHMAQKLSGDLAKAGFCVVSGFAMGIDVAAHRATLEAGGRTVAALGCGLNINYPADHYSLKKKIAQNGAVISQFGLTAPPGKTTFPIRNRVVAGLTLGTLVVEAPLESGALITAYAALDEGKEVFATPGQVNSKKSEGANRLIQKGYAKLCMGIDDIIDDLPDHARGWAKNRQLAMDLGEEKVNLELDEEERMVATALEDGQKHIDEVAIICGLPLGKVSAILLSLEIKGLARQSAGKMFMRS